MKKSLLKIVAPLIAAGLILSGCTDSTQSTASGELSSVDEMFLEMMIPHHNQAVEMSHLAEENTTNPEILALAALIDDEQHHEIDLMSGWLGKDVGHDHSHDSHDMDGMLSAEQMDQLAKAKDAEFDRLFLEGMILHHEGAIEMTQMVIASENAEVSELAASIVKTQTAQIEQMQQMLKDLN